jgi:hypothetical protein
VADILFLIGDLVGPVAHHALDAVVELFYSQLNRRAKGFRNGAFISVTIAVVVMILGLLSLLPALVSVILFIAAIVCFWVCAGLCLAASDSKGPEPRQSQSRETGRLGARPPSQP